MANIMLSEHANDIQNLQFYFIFIYKKWSLNL